ncbi:Rho GTPase activation protein [Coprinellus micaceus]|uniref:Rho GTPase activation protein n=1 Tax=Coprinellus micaceus TaxID=71717 RepID=A0A4Y7TLI5_COPMI|nr:Rho GTPase activation protein [Coprinellus micaceus]
MADSWDHYGANQNESLREFLVSAELYVSSAAGSSLRKPAVIRKKEGKDSKSTTNAVDESKAKEKSSLGLSKRLAGAGQWRNATCKLLEEGDRCFLNIYVDEAILYQTVYLHLLNQTDIPASRPFPILPQRLCRVILHRVGRSSPCVAVSKSSDTQPIPVFPNSDVCSTWLALLRSLDIVVWKEKKVMKPSMVGFIRIPLSNFRRGEPMEGWFPIMQSQAGPTREIQVGELRLKIRVDEEIVLPYSAYKGLLKSFHSRNFLDWLSELETKMKLKELSTPVMSLAVANNTLIKQIQDYATREVLESAGSHQTLFRGNTVLTKVMELAMTWYGKNFLDASIGPALRRLCAEKVAIEVDPMRSRKGTKDVERNVELLIHWCQEFWNQIYSVRNECPNELRRLFQTIRTLVEERTKPESGGPSAEHRDLPKQSVSAFCFLRFIVPAILHPHLFGLYPGLPPEPVQRSLTLIAKVIQSLANLNASVQKESFMAGVKDFLTTSLPAMVDYITAVSAPLDHPYPSNPAMAMARHNRLSIVNSLRERSGKLTVLDREAIPVLPYLLDIPRQLAIITSAVIRSTREPSLQTQMAAIKGTPLEELCARCFEAEEQALVRVTQLAAKLSLDKRRPSLPHISSTQNGSGPSGSMASLDRAPETPRPTPRVKRKSLRPSTAPSSGSNSSPSRKFVFNDDMPSPGIFGRSKVPQEPRSPPTSDAQRVMRRPLHVKAPSTDSVPTYKNTGKTVTSPTKPREPLNDQSDDANKRKKGILRGILRL